MKINLMKIGLSLLGLSLIGLVVGIALVALMCCFYLAKFIFLKLWGLFF